MQGTSSKGVTCPHATSLLWSRLLVEEQTVHAQPPVSALCHTTVATHTHTLAYPGHFKHGPMTHSQAASQLSASTTGTPRATASSSFKEQVSGSGLMPTPAQHPPTHIQ